MSISIKSFGRTPEGEKVTEYTIKNSSGSSISLLNYGAIIRTIIVPDRNGKLEDIAPGFDTLEEYMNNTAYVGAVVGRYGNRIANGRFTLNGILHELNRNANGHALHGGPGGFHTKVWNAQAVSDSKVRMSYMSADMEEGYPGNLMVSLDYSFCDDTTLTLEYTVTTDADTIHNITHHAYFNLDGHSAGSILGHRIMLNADAVTPVSSQAGIPTGEVLDVCGTAFDFKVPQIIAEMLDTWADDEQIMFGRGYDVNFVIKGDGYRKCVEVTGESSGRIMEVFTDQPGVQLYTGNLMPDITGKAGTSYNKQCAFCLETQHFPDSINQPKFPPVILMAGETFSSKTAYHFGVTN